MIIDPISGFGNLSNVGGIPITNGFWLALKLIYQTSFLWLPPALMVASWRLWVTWKQAEFIAAQKSVLLEVILPQAVTRTPQAMELFFTALFQTGGEGTWIDRWIKGKSRPWFSCELVSIDGMVKFHIWTRPAWKNHIESQIYAQYPGTEVREVPDYTLPVAFDPSKVVVWGCEFKLNKPDPYPIKTYLDYRFISEFPGIPEAEKVDPIASTVEYLASLGPGEQAWIQIIIRAHKKDRKKAGTWFEMADWKEDLKKEVDKILAKEKKSRADDDTLTALERSVGKFPFETGIRALYVAKKENFNPIRISGLTGAFRQYNSNNLNGFAPTGGMTIFSYPWQDYKEYRQNSTRRQLLDAYKRRSYFYPPYKRRHFILNTEELATIFHFPGTVVTTPTLSRVGSKKGEPPPDLPI